MTRRRGLSTLAAACLLLGAAGPASAETSLTNPPPGANDFGCKPPPAHPRPVVLVHGLGANMRANWSYHSPLLAAQGYCVFALTYGIDPREPDGMEFGGLIPIERSALELKAFVERVLAATGAREVDLVGHSEGTFMPQYWLKFLRGADVVRRYVALTPLYQGTQLARADLIRDIGAMVGADDDGIAFVSQFCGSCPQFVAGSEMVRRLAEGGAAVGGVQYTTIPTTYDELVVPWQSGLLVAPNATNRVLQEVCPGDTSEHAALAFDPVVAQLIFNALDPAMAVDVECAGAPPLSGAPPRYAAGLPLLETELEARIRRGSVRRLRLVSLPAGVTVRVSCAAPRRPRRPCPFGSWSGSVAQTVLDRELNSLFRRHRLGPGTRIRVAVGAPGVRGKLFSLRVGRGRSQPRTACFSPTGGSVPC